MKLKDMTKGALEYRLRRIARLRKKAESKPCTIEAVLEKALLIAEGKA